MIVLTGCLPELEADLSRVDAPRVLAVSAVPAEVAPGDAVTLTALYADADGLVAAAPLTWSLCAARRPLAELGPIHRDCLQGQGDALAPIGVGLTVQATIPDDVCRRFGPEPPLATAGQPTGRPVDPDVTGGYYQPVLLDPQGDGRALFQIRVDCGVAGATQAQAAELRRRHLANVAPEIVAVSRSGETVGETLTVDAGEAVALHVQWRTCPERPVCGDGVCTLDEVPADCPGDCTGTPGCGGAESYVRFDPVALALTTAREAMRVAWYATDGHFAAASTGRASDDVMPGSENTWTAPAQRGPVALWIVIRDDRGGAAWRAIDIDVRQ